MLKNLLANTWAVLRTNAVTILITLFSLQLLRLLFASLVGFLRDAQGISAMNLAPLALGIFSFAFLAALPPRILGLRRTLWFITGGLVLVRLVEQFSRSPLLDLVLSAVGVVLFLLYLPLALGIARAQGNKSGAKVGVALLLGFSLDAAILTASNTLDLTWQTGFWPVLILAFFSLMLLLALGYESTRLDFEAPLDGSWKANLPLIAFGPWFLLQMLLYQNVAAISTLTGWEIPLAGGFVLLSNVLALSFIVYTDKLSITSLVKILLSSLLLVSSLQFIVNNDSPAALLILIGAVLSSYLLFTVLSAACSDKGKSGLVHTAISLAFGQILFLLFTFLYYLTYDIDLGFRSATLYPVMGVVLSLCAIVASLRRGEPASASMGYYPAMAGLILILVPVISAFFWRQPAIMQPAASNRQLRVMTYNLHNGFNRQGRLDMETLAQNIEDSGADVVALQEVSRGWLIWGSLDMLAWLSQRLDMHAISGATADPQWGNAILTHLPIRSVTRFKLPTEDLLLRRGYIHAEIDFGGDLMQVIATHYHHIEEDSDIRVLESQAILDQFPFGKPALLMGDLNAIPAWDEMQLLADAGLVDAAAALGTPPTYTYPSDLPDRQIDFIWFTPQLSGRDFAILQSTASDHLPMVVTVVLKE